jgi:hypothetical protein
MKVILSDSGGRTVVVTVHVDEIVGSEGESVLRTRPLAAKSIHGKFDQPFVFELPFDQPFVFEGLAAPPMGGEG